MARDRRIFIKYVMVLVCALLFRDVAANVIGEHHEADRQKEVANEIKAHSLNQESHLADKSSENKNAVSDNKNSQFVGAKDSGHYVNQDGKKNIVDDNKAYGGHAFNQDQGENGHGVSLKKGHKKGQHNAGFHNSYHKDETSNNSSFFDDYVDENDQTNYQRGQGRYGNEAGKRYHGKKEDGLQHIQENARQGNYDKRAGADVRNADHHDYDRKRLQDDHRDASQNQRGQSYNGRDRQYGHSQAQEQSPQYHQGPSYYDRPVEYHPPRLPPPHYHRREYDEPRPLEPLPPLPPPVDYRRNDRPSDRRRQTITIYDDPRIRDPYRGNGALREESDYVRLDVRPGGPRFQRYDSYYDRPPAPRRGWGVNQRSDINPLVFNYKRY